MNIAKKYAINKEIAFLLSEKTRESDVRKKKKSG